MQKFGNVKGKCEVTGTGNQYTGTEVFANISKTFPGFEDRIYGPRGMSHITYS
mgnify:CR=1 FL=1|jgi:hypothetical protein